MGFIHDFVKTAQAREELKTLCVDDTCEHKCAQLYELLSTASDHMYEALIKQASASNTNNTPNYVTTTSYLNKMANFVVSGGLSPSTLHKIAAAVIVDDTLSAELERLKGQECVLSTKYATARAYGRDFMLSLWYQGLSNE